MSARDRSPESDILRTVNGGSLWLNQDRTLPQLVHQGDSRWATSTRLFSRFEKAHSKHFYRKYPLLTHTV
jgi:hypothetical protein